ncbi:MAG: hypothetical protein M5U26_28950 [Planctomycetota bacterium]|nr:hypothetical protein [Planctomycetota bacterium]
MNPLRAPARRVHARPMAFSSPCLRVSVAIGILLGCVAAAASDAGDPGREARAKLRQGLLDHFHFGICAPVEWCNETRDQNGAKWKFRQQYFSGGAAKDKSWDSVFLNPWNKWVNPDKRKGVWAENFIKPTIENGYVPWITFYNLAQSNPADYKPGPAQAAPANAAVAETMKSYWEQVKLLMQLCDKFKPHPVVVQVEPDEWGHLLLSKREGKALFPEKVDVKVGSCGMEDVKGLPDNLVGYAQAWYKLRNAYAPSNVLLVTNPSAWDWRGSMAAENWVEIFKQCGVDQWDGAVLEFGDRDLGCSGKAPPYTEADYVTRFASYDQMLKWIETLHKGTGLWVWMWQVAIGNTYFKTCNQTDGHYCDGIAQSILEGYPGNPTIGRFAAAGCAGFVFNAGQGFQTHCTDDKKDGITNPDPIPGNLGHESKYADDDGGYIRLRVGEYYKQPFKMLGGGPQVAAAPAKSPEASRPAEAQAPPKPEPPPKPSVDPAKLAEWDPKLKECLRLAVKDGKAVNAYLRLFGPQDQLKRYRLGAVGDADLQVLVQGNKMPVPWANLSVAERANLAKGLVEALGEDAPALVLAGVYLAADGNAEQSDEAFAKASLKDAAAVSAAKVALGLAQ